MCCDCANALNLIGADSDTETGAADKEGAVDFPIRYELSGGGGTVWVCRLIIDREATDVRYGFNARVVLEVGLDLVFVVDAGVLVNEETSVSFIPSGIGCK
jgi:hypothetical protein